jgi:hypothetical protein
MHSAKHPAHNAPLIRPPALMRSAPAPRPLSKAAPVSLDLARLPEQALPTTLRMPAALALSLTFNFTSRSGATFLEANQRQMSGVLQIFR